jgi:integrase
VLTAAERARFLGAGVDSFYGVFYRTLIDTGLRPGEACALTWADVDFVRGTIGVQRIVSDVLGHAKIQQTANTYMHGERAVNRRLDAALRSARQSRGDRRSGVGKLLVCVVWRIIDTPQR